MIWFLVGPLEAWIPTSSGFPVPSKEEEVALAERFRLENDVNAARQLVLSHLRFVVNFARGYLGYGLPRGDLIQEGNVGLMKAVKRFDPAVGVRIVSFAVHWIRAEIHQYVIRWRLLKVVSTKAQRKLFFNLRKLKKTWGGSLRGKSAPSLAIEEGEVREMEQRLSARDVSFGPTPERDEEASYSPTMYLTTNNADPASEIERDEWKKDSSDRVASVLDKLNARSRNILKRRWMTESRATLQELADEYGISVERVRQLENNTIRRLKNLVAPI